MGLGFGACPDGVDHAGRERQGLRARGNGKRRLLPSAGSWPRTVTSSLANSACWGLFVVPKALAVAALQRLRRGPLATAPLATLARFLHSGLLGHPLHLEQHRGAYRAHADALRAGLCDACGANTTGHRRRPRGAGSGCRVLDDGDSSDRCAGCLSRHTAPYLLAATHAARGPCAVLFNHRERAACLSNDAWRHPS